MYFSSLDNATLDNTVLVSLEMSKKQENVYKIKVGAKTSLLDQVLRGKRGVFLFAVEKMHNFHSLSDLENFIDNQGKTLQLDTSNIAVVENSDKSRLITYKFSTSVSKDKLDSFNYYLVTYDIKKKSK